jgi:hypothetical protein
MAPERRSRAVVLTALLVVLALVAMYQWWPRPSANGGATSNERAPRQASARRGQSGVEAPVVHLPALEDQRPKPQAGERNLFRFRVKTAPAPAPSTGVAPPPAPPPTATGTGIAPITLRFIGIIDRGGGQPKIAALVDPTGHAINCLEGGDCDGRYHIWRVGAESVDISYLDGTGRRTIRLGGG